MLKKILLVLVIVVGVLAGIVALQPSTFHIERSATMSAPPAKVFAQVNDFHAWQAWSPWAKLDPAAKVSFEGPAAGEGAVYKWSGNSDVGEGSMTLLESHPNDRIGIKLDFIKPFAGTNQVEFTFKPEGDKTLVTWSMSGTNGFVSKAFCLLMNMQKIVGGEFDKGLASIKAIVESTDKNTDKK